MSYADLVSANPLRHAWFVLFDFASGPMRVWNGFRNIEIGGFVWSPVGPQATIDQIEDPVADTVPSIVMRVSGVDATLLADALAGATEIQGRLAFIFDCFFDASWQPITTLESYSLVRMDTIKIKREQSGDADKHWEQTIELTCENFLTQGPYPPYGRYTTADQVNRFPGVTDLYFEYMPANQNRRLRWPTF